MNEIMRCIRSRRSCRNFKPDPLREEELEQVIEAGLWAPSGNNKQPWYFTVIRNKRTVEKINNDAKENAVKYLTDPNRLSVANNKNFDLFYGAPCIIIISADMRSGTAVADCSAAIQNMLLMAENLKIGSLWNGIIRRFWFETPGVAAFKQEYEIPEEFTPLYAVAFGYWSKEIPEGPERKKNAVNYYN
ncbi:MAG TPA: nitroreductase family protein [Clostridiales bacterium]|nr:nitroreductase family protein [Clostridiales bacterium]